VDERITLGNLSYFKSYGQHIQRYEFAGRYSQDKRVLDAGCGTGYGSWYLANGVAREVASVDLSQEAIAEARTHYRRSNLTFHIGNVERLSEVPGLAGPFDTVVNLENIEHLKNPEQFLDGARQLLGKGGCLVTSTPNGAVSDRDASGRPKNPHHEHEFTEDEFRRILEPRFAKVSLFGQWVNPEGRYRAETERMLFEQLNELYYNPLLRLGRGIKRLLGRPVAGPPEAWAAGSGLSWERVIRPLEEQPYPWPAEVLLAVCEA
jgi:2-polyprenyl-3-methyl-5-hydroxy-6-metoxy-1,4-benzoquinol methylase